MGPPGGGRSYLSPRFLRHFNVISMAIFSDEAMLTIFNTIVNHVLKVLNFALLHDEASFRCSISFMIFIVF